MAESQPQCLHLLPTFAWRLENSELVDSACVRHAVGAAAVGAAAATTFAAHFTRSFCV